MHRLSFITLNVRGINSSRKRRAIFRQLHNKNASVIFLQETYSSNNQEKLWSNEWGSKIHFCHGNKHSKGVAILFSPKIQVTIENQMQSEDGQILTLQVVIDDAKLVCANIYAPNDPGAQHRFYLHLNNILQKFSSESVILGGDFNCPLSKEDKEGGRDFSHKYHVAEEIKSLTCSLDLEDVWRNLHPNKKQFKHQIKKSDQKIRSKQLLQQSLARECEINFAPHCDKKVRQSRGPGFWKFNPSVLEDSDYTSVM